MFFYRKFLMKLVDHYTSGEIRTKRYYLNDQLHRENGPAIIDYYKSGKIKYKSYIINNYGHRLDGPARSWHDESGEIEQTNYYVKGIYLLCFELYGKDKIFKYIQNFPQFIKEIEILARHNKWLTEEQIVLLNTISVFK